MGDGWKRFGRDPLATAGLVLLLGLGTLALAAPWVVPHDPEEVRMAHRLAGPSGEFWLGTDQFGRDLFSRLVVGARVSLATAGLVLASVMCISLALGMVAGYAGGAVDAAVMRVVDVLLALPGLVLAVAIVGVLGPNLPNLVLALVATSWAYHARLIRGLVLQVREHEYVTAAVAAGAGPLRVMLRHLLPVIAGPVWVLASFDVGRTILAISGLSFLGLGAQPPTPEWGAMLNEARPFFQAAPLLMVYPGLAILVTVMAFNLVGDGLRDALDPRTGFSARE